MTSYVKNISPQFCKQPLQYLVLAKNQKRLLTPGCSLTIQAPVDQVSQSTSLSVYKGPTYQIKNQKLPDEPSRS